MWVFLIVCARNETGPFTTILFFLVLAFHEGVAHNLRRNAVLWKALNEYIKDK